MLSETFIKQYLYIQKYLQIFLTFSAVSPSSMNTSAFSINSYIIANNAVFFQSLHFNP